MTYARPAVVCWLLLVFASPTLQAFAQDNRGDRGSETDHLEGENRQIADWVIACQRAGWEDLDIEVYLSQFAEDATVVLGRSGEPGKYDTTYDYIAIVATRTMRMRGENPGVVLRYVDITAEIDGDDAVMTTRTIASSRGSEDREVMNERFALRRSGDSWLVVENRAWLVGKLIDGERHVVDASAWEEWDRWIKEERQGAHDTRLLWGWLLQAFRFEEAHAMAVRVCGQEDVEAEDWSRRGVSAVLAGDAQDAELAFSRAIEMDPGVWLPSYVIPADDQ